MWCKLNGVFFKTFCEFIEKVNNLLKMCLNIYYSFLETSIFKFSINFSLNSWSYLHY